MLRPVGAPVVVEVGTRATRRQRIALETVTRHDGQELDVGEAHLGDVVRELVGQLAVVQETVALFRHAPNTPTTATLSSLGR